MSAVDVSNYEHSAVHKAIISKDYDGLRTIIDGLPKLCDPLEINTESVSLAEEAKFDARADVIDRRDVPNRDTPLHLAVKLSDVTAAEILMLAGAQNGLHNEQGWTALQEAICNREEAIAKIILRHASPLSWDKWRRRLPLWVETLRRMRDFYMEITFHFESSVIPFVSRIAPSDTYKIWKRGPNLRADLTLAGFDNLKIKRSHQSILFFGEGSENGEVPPGSLCKVSHKKKVVRTGLTDFGDPPTDAEAQQEVIRLSQVNMFRPGIRVTEAVLLPQTTWRKQERTEMVGPWKAKVYDMPNVVVSFTTRRAPGAMVEDESKKSCNEKEIDKELDGILTDEEKKQLEAARNMSSEDMITENVDGIIEHGDGCCEQTDIPIEGVNNDKSEETKQDIAIEDVNNSKSEEKNQESPIEGVNNHKSEETKDSKKRWKLLWKRRHNKLENNEKKVAHGRSSSRSHEKVSDLLEDAPVSQNKSGRHSADAVVKRDDHRKGQDTKACSSTSNDSGTQQRDGSRENARKSIVPVLWLSPDFPLRVEELFPLLDILANKVKSVQRLRELLSTKLPKGTFPVKVSFPVVPTVRVFVTFTKFHELPPLDDFSTPPSSPTSLENDNSNFPSDTPSNSSWVQWVKSSYQHLGSNNKTDDTEDPFSMPSDYSWISLKEKEKKRREKRKSEKTKGQK